MVAVLGVVVLIVAVLALQNPKVTTTAGASGSSVAKTVAPSSSSARASTRAPTSSADRSPSPAPTSRARTNTAGSAVHPVPLVVLNNSTSTGLARLAAQQFESAGWSVTDTGNLRNDIASTCAYYDPSDTSALAAAQALQHQFPAIKRVKPKFAELPSGPIVVVLTSDFTLG